MQTIPIATVRGFEPDGKDGMACESEDLPTVHHEAAFGGKVSSSSADIRPGCAALRGKTVLHINCTHMKKVFYLLTVVITTMIASSCEKEKDANSTPLPPNMHGVFIVNEGAFGQGNASVSFASSDSSYFTDDLFTAANGYPVGDLLQSMTIYHSVGYLCVNNSQRVEVVSMTDFKKKATITGINSPRFMVGYNNDGYISDWGTNSVYKINLLNNTITGSVLCGSGPEQMLVSGSKLFVCNGGGYAEDSTITVIDLNSFTVTDTIQTDINPSSIRKDKDGKIWVLCRGSLGTDFTPTPDDAPGSILQIDPNSYSFLKQITLNWDQHPVQLNANGNGDKIYFLVGSGTYTGSVYTMSINDNVLPASPLINREFYSLGIHPSSNIIYAGKSSFSANTHFLRYTMNGTLIDSTLTGIGPNSFVFN